MILQGLFQKAFAAVLAVATFVSSAPTRSSNTVEFYMKTSTHELIEWYKTDQTLDQIRETSERNFGNVNQCPTTVKEGANLPINEKSTCPWFYKLNHTSSRYPANILYAHSPCTHCIGGNKNLLCHPVKRTVSVLNQKEDISGEIRYEAEDIEIAVGFTCGGRNFVDNAPPTTAAPPNYPFTFARRK